MKSQDYERLWQQLLESIPTSVLVLDTNGRIESANANFLRRGRLREGDVLGKRLEDVLPATIVSSMNLRQRLAEVVRTREPVLGERFSYRAPGLATRYYIYRLIPVTEGEKVVQVLVWMEDITEQIRLGEEARRIENHLASVVESASDLVISLDLAGRVRTWNSAAVRLTGYNEVEVQNIRLGELCREPVLMAEYLTRIVQQQTAETIEVELLGKDAAQTVPIAWIASPMYDVSSEVTGMVVIGRDLSERRRFEAQLVQSEKLAALGVMAGGIAHEIRNPLAIISSAAQLLMTPRLPRDLQQECSEGIYRGVQRATNVIDGLLRFARPVAPRDRQLLDWGALIHESCSFVEEPLKQSNVELLLQLPDAPIQLRGSESLLPQVVVNLLQNAIHAMPVEGGQIEVTLRQLDGEALLTIRDTGKGIPAANLSKVFDPFFTTMPVGKGTGLGLSICYTIVKEHQGRIEFSSTEGVGTTVMVWLPLAET